MEIEIISKEYIKPSSPTPFHLKTHKLSLLDKYAARFYVPVVLYYDPIANQEDHSNFSKTDIISKRIQLLKQSLSEALTLLYPFAGTIKDKLSIDCNDEGVCFIEARMKNSILLSEFLNQPDLSLISKFIPKETTLSQQPISGANLAFIQVTSFSCGGIVIGASFHHTLVDGKSMGTFLKCWAEATCKFSSKETSTSYNINPDFGSSYSFPPTDVYPEEATCTALINSFLKTARWVVKRFVFDASTIAKLKSKSTSSQVENPTRVETVSAMLFKCIHDVFGVNNSDIHKSTIFSHAINLRPRAIPPFSQQTIGNYAWMAAAPVSRKKVDQEERELQDLVCQMREVIRKVDGDFVKRLQGDEGFSNLIEASKNLCKVFSGVDDYVGFSSWCKFGFYEVDFGWGKPTWVSCTGLDETHATTFLNSIILMDTKSGDGIEAWVYLREEDMTILLQDEELLSYALLDPSPLR